MATNLDDDRLRQYLLGGLQGEECVALEEEYVVDESALDRVQAAEYDLIDAYLAGQLAPGDRERFDRHYLASPVHRHRVATARQLRLAADRHDAAPKANAARTSREIRFGLTWVLAAAALVLAIAGGAWLMRARLAPTVGPAGAQNPAGAPAPRPYRGFRRSQPLLVGDAGGVRGLSGHRRGVFGRRVEVMPRRNPRAVTSTQRDPCGWR